MRVVVLVAAVDVVAAVTAATMMRKIIVCGSGGWQGHALVIKFTDRKMNVSGATESQRES